jgi:hypothetical protein
MAITALLVFQAAHANQTSFSEIFLLRLRPTEAPSLARATALAQCRNPAMQGLALPPR